MRQVATIALLLAVVVPAFSGGVPARADTAGCGRSGYPDAASFSEGAVVDPGLWDAFRDHGGFANGTEGQGAVEVRVTDGSTVFIVRVEESVVRHYVGGQSSNLTVVAVTIRAETTSGQILWAWRLTDLYLNRKGGNLTVVAWASGGAVEVFWRWAYLPCDESFPTTYFVFHASVGASGYVTDDNTLVYFEAPRPRRAPPADLILLIVAGFAASAIFLSARRALKKRQPSKSESSDRTVK